MDTLIGKTLSHYRVVEKIGEGGMGVVYRATDSILHRDVALKVIHPDRSGDRIARARFLRECRAAAAINHPNIATVFDAGESEDGALYFVSELVEGETLQAALARGRFRIEQAIGFASQLAEALAAAHAQGIIHRDIKPANIAITPGGRLKVLDFGLARLGLDEARPDGADASTVTGPLTEARVLLGTPAYMSPEQAAGLAVDARSDVFSAGAVIYEMLAGRPAFAAPTQEETLQRVLSVEPKSLSDLDPLVPPALAQAVTRALIKDRSGRLASGRALADELRSLQPGTTAAAQRRASVGTRVRRRLRLAVAAAFVLCAASVAVLWILGRRHIHFAGRDTLLVADVDNRTADAVFDVALKSAIESDLQQSRYANVFEQSRVAETLQLMRRDPGARITESIGRDICRYAGLKALLLPRILSVGDAYDLSVMLIEPSTGRAVNRVRVTVQGRGQVLLDAVDQVTRKVRVLLGESLDSIATSDLRIAQATTASWEALRDLSLGQRAWDERRFNDAAALFERALEEDPHFMAAHGSLGLLLIQFLGQPERGKKLLRQALAESDSVTLRERFLIRALNRQFVEENPEEALSEYRLIIEAYPDMWQAYNNSGQILRGLGRPEEAVAMFERANRVAPTWPIPLTSLYWTYLSQLARPAAAESVARRMIAMDPNSADYLDYLGWSQVAQARYADAESTMHRVLEIDPRHGYARGNLANLLYATGHPGEAVPILREIRQRTGADSSAYVSACIHLALAQRAAGAAREAEGVLDSTARWVEGFRGARARIPEMRVDLALIAAARGQEQRALALLREAAPATDEDPVILLGISKVHALLGDCEGSIAFLQRALRAGYYDRYYPLVGPEFAPIRAASQFWEFYPECQRPSMSGQGG